MNEQENSQPQENVPMPQTAPEVAQRSSTAEAYFAEEARRKAVFARAATGRGLCTALLCLLLGVLFCETILFTSGWGIAVTVWVLAFYGVLCCAFYEKQRPFSKSTKLVAIPTLLLAVSFFLHYNPSTQWITMLMLFALLVVQLVLAGGVKTGSIFSLDMLCKTADSVLGGLFRNFTLPFYSCTTLKRGDSKAAKNVLYVLIGTVVALPVGGILLTQFMEADQLFSEAAWNLMNRFFDSTFHTVGVVIWGAVFGLLLGACVLGLRCEQREQKSRGAVVGKVSGVIIGTFLTFISVLTVAFVGFQFNYLFGGPQDLSAYDITYAEYARSGFFALCQASALLLGVVVLVLVFTKRNGEKLPLFVRAAIVLLCLCDGVMLASAVKRMLLYVGEFDLSIKRMLTLWLMALIGICLIGVVVKCVCDKINLFRWLGVTAIVGVCVLSLANTERLVARYNVEKALANPTQNNVDISYLRKLSYTVVPEVMRLKTIGYFGEESAGAYTKQRFARSLGYYRNDDTNVLYRQESIYNFSLDSIEADLLIQGLR